MRRFPEITETLIATMAEIVDGTVLIASILFVIVAAGIVGLAPLPRRVARSIAPARIATGASLR